LTSVTVMPGISTSQSASLTLSKISGLNIAVTSFKDNPYYFVFNLLSYRRNNILKLYLSSNGLQF
jgi:hypothetical protein